MISSETFRWPQMHATPHLSIDNLLSDALRQMSKKKNYSKKEKEKTETHCQHRVPYSEARK